MGICLEGAQNARKPPPSWALFVVKWQHKPVFQDLPVFQLTLTVSLLRLVSQTGGSSLADAEPRQFLLKDNFLFVYDMDKVCIVAIFPIR